ncbi:hypothetical protein PTKIN_Ptkin01aG0070700 [Pterospermum kingtungense]
MSSCNYHLHILPLVLFLLLGINNAVSNSEEYKTYIVHMDHSRKPSSFLTYESWHRATLRSLLKPVDDKEMLLYSYNYVMQGFSARLTQSQLSEIKKSPAHIATHEDRFGKLLTTHSPEFLGLRHSSGLWNVSAFGEGVIIGMIDSGVWPESESFNEKGMPPIPLRWTGKCQNNTSDPFLCNKKLIGAQGVARGIAPRAYVAMYKVSSGEFVAESDVLAAMDQAIADGVDIMSLSLGFEPVPYFQDIIAIASLSAIEKGIVVTCAAGNDGAHYSTLNGAPWITTVGAGTLDRSFIATVTLGNNLTFKGKSDFPDRVIVLDTPLYYGKDDFNKGICSYGTLNQSEVYGNVVFCDISNSSGIFEQAEELARVGAVTSILVTDSTDIDDDGLNIPCMVLPTSYGAMVKKYAIEAADKAEVQIMRFALTSFGTKPAPQVADFSSRGPDPVNPNILKPDIISPGVQILAAYPPNISVGSVGHYDLASDYALLSGTSMSTPHVAGVAALLKAIHPEWSPTAVRSALMTTAYTIDNNGSTLTNQPTNLPGTPLDYGAGHINPNKAMNPGLIYDIDWQGYVDFLCGLGYNDTEMRAILRKNQWNCSQEGTDLNYPSFFAIFSKNASSPNVKNFTRVVTNVGDDQSVYQAIVETTTPGMTIKVNPPTLTFTEKYQKQSYVMSVQTYEKSPPVAYSYLRWLIKITMWLQALWWSSISNLHQRLAYAKVCIELDAAKEIPKLVMVKMKDESLISVRVEVPWFPAKCTHCLLFGHEDKACPKKPVVASNKVWVVKQCQNSTGESSSDSIQDETTTDEGFVDSKVVRAAALGVAEFMDSIKTKPRAKGGTKKQLAKKGRRALLALLTVTPANLPLQLSMLLAGDFNVIAGIEESSSVNQVFTLYMKEFVDCKKDLGLHDHTYNGPVFTWTNRKSWTIPVYGRRRAMNILFHKLKRLEADLRQFNKGHFGDLSRRIQSKREQLAEIQNEIIQSVNFTGLEQRKF